jgi:hypothetical protein
VSAAAILTLMEAKLLCEGQLQGRRARLPVFFGRRPAEPVDQDLVAFYERLLKDSMVMSFGMMSGGFVSGTAGPTIRTAGIFSPDAEPRTGSATSLS